MKKNLMFLSLLAAGVAMSGCTQQAAAVDGLSPNGGYGTPGAYDGSGGEVVAGDSVALGGQDVSSAGSNGVNGSSVGGSRVGSGSVGGSSSGYGSGAGGSGKNSVYFGYDSNNLQGSERSKISSDASNLQSKSSVKVAGNSDEFGTDEYNYALGLRRAKAVKDEMVSRGVDGSKVSVVSYGESNPVCADGTKECYQKNRRADYN